MVMYKNQSIPSLCHRLLSPLKVFKNDDVTNTYVRPVKEILWICALQWKQRRLYF